MKNRIFLVIALIITQVQMVCALDKHKDIWWLFDNIVEIEIIGGYAKKNSFDNTKDCWTNYEASVRKSFKGKVSELKSFDFSGRKFLVGERYLIFFNTWENKQSELDKLGGLFEAEKEYDIGFRKACDKVNHDLIFNIYEVGLLEIRLSDNNPSGELWVRDYSMDFEFSKTVRVSETHLNVMGIPFRLVNYEDLIREWETEIEK